MYGLIKIAELYPKEQLPPILGGATRPANSRPLSQLEQMAQEDAWKPTSSYEDLAKRHADASGAQNPSILNMWSDELDAYRKQQQLLFEKEYGVPAAQTIEQTPKTTAPPPHFEAVQHAQVEPPESKVKTALRESDGVARRYPVRSAVGFGLAGAGLAGLGVAAYNHLKGER